MTSSRFRYQDLRGLTRHFSLDLPVSMSKVQMTSFAVNGLPSCQVMPCRSGKVNAVPSSFQDQPVARSGRIDWRLFCGTCWSNMTRLLNTSIIGPSAKTVASSWIDMLAGLSGLYIFRMPPCFWANAASAANIARDNEPAAANPRRLRFISVHLPWLSRGRPVPSWLGSLTKLAAEPCYPRLIAELLFKMPTLGVYHRSIERGRMAAQQDGGPPVRRDPPIFPGAPVFSYDACGCRGPLLPECRLRCEASGRHGKTPRLVS